MSSSVVTKGSVKEWERIKLGTKGVVFERHEGTWKFTLLWGFTKPANTSFKDGNTDMSLESLLKTNRASVLLLYWE